jgi:hypothetical protein
MLHPMPKVEHIWTFGYIDNEDDRMIGICGIFVSSEMKLRLELFSVESAKHRPPHVQSGLANPGRPS